MINNNINGNGLTTAQVQQLIAEGHGVISHTQGHANVSTTLATSEAALRADLLGSKNAIEAITGVKVESFVYPSGDRNAATDAIVKDYYDYGIAVNGDTNIDISGGKYDMKYAYMNLTRCAIGQYYDGSGGWKDVAGVRYYGSNAGTDTFSNAGGTLNTSSLEYYKARVKEANDNNDFLIFMLHGYGGNYAPGATQANYLGALLDYIKTLNIDTTVLR